MSCLNFPILKTVEHVAQVKPMGKTGAGILGLVDHLKTFQHQMPDVDTRESAAVRLHSRYQGAGLHRQNLKACGQKLLLDLKLYISSTGQTNYFKLLRRKFNLISV